MHPYGRIKPTERDNRPIILKLDFTIIYKFLLTGPITSIASNIQ